MPYSAAAGTGFSPRGSRSMRVSVMGIRCASNSIGAVETSMTDFFRAIDAAVKFDAGKATKADLFQGHFLFVGLNCFEPGQSQKIHVHGGSDKFYLVLSGKASMIVGEQSREVGAGTIVWAPANVPHGVERALERTVMLVAMGPPPNVSRPP